MFRFFNKYFVCCNSFLWYNSFFFTRNNKITTLVWWWAQTLSIRQLGPYRCSHDDGPRWSSLARRHEVKHHDPGRTPLRFIGPAGPATGLEHGQNPHWCHRRARWSAAVAPASCRPRRATKQLTWTSRVPRCRRGQRRTCCSLVAIGVYFAARGSKFLSKFLQKGP